MQDQHYAWLAKSFGRTDYLPLPAGDVEALLAAGEPIEKRPGSYLFKEGADSAAAFIVEKGTVELTRELSTGTSVVGRVGNGAVIGDIALFREEPYFSSARAVDQVTAYRLDRSKLLELLLGHPRLSLRWLVVGLNQLERTQRRVVRLINRSVLQQVAGILMDEVDASGEVHISQASIATLLGVSRQSVNEAVAELKGFGAVDTAYRTIRVLDRGVLQEQAREG